MANCPEGHPNPSHWEFCGECGAPIDDSAKSSRWHRTRPAIVAVSIVAVLTVAGVVVGLVVTRKDTQSIPPAPATTGSAAIRDWWPGAHPHFIDLQNAVDDTQRALDRADRRSMETACQQMHDTAEVELQAHLPTPDPNLTSELRAAAEDAHAAAHMCLSAIAGTMNNYGGEFKVDLDQAAKRLKKAQELVNIAMAATA